LWEKTAMKILFVLHDGDTGGATTPVLETIDALAGTDFSFAALVPQPGSLSAALSQRGVPWKALPLPHWTSTKGRRRFRNIWDNWKAIPAVVNAVRAIAPDLVLSNSATIGIGSMAAAHLGIRHVWWLQEFVWDDHQLAFDFGWKLTGWLMDQRSVLALVASRAIGAKWAPYIGPHKQAPIDYHIKELPSAAEAPAFKPAGAFHLVLAGSLNPQKGQMDAIDAMGRLHTRNVHLHLFGAGGRGYTARLRARAGTLGLDDQVHFHGHVEGVGARMQQADAILVTSRCEALGRVVIEAMRSGVPIVATDAGGIPELIENGRTGILYPPGDAAALSEAIEHLIASPQYAASLGAAAKEWASQRYGAAQFAAAIEAALRRADATEIAPRTR
jgi:glycosyltransferase involved in cell wall biosynthesis